MNTALITLLVPVCLIGSIYLAIFFTLNSSYAPAIFHGQLSNFLRGDFYADRLSTDGLLRTLTIDNVRLSETASDRYVVLAPKLEAKIPLEELIFIITDSTFKLGRVKLTNPDVNLDFSRGELNILKVVLPYFSAPEPPDNTPGSFVTWLSDLNVENASVHLIFDGFRIDLEHVNVDHYAIEIANELVMSAPAAADNNGICSVRVESGEVRFNPATFSFPLANVGDASRGLVFSGGAQSSGKIGYAFTGAADQLLRLLPAENNTAPHPQRGDFIVKLKNTQVDHFHWQGNTMFIPNMHTLADGGSINLSRAMMNVGPTQQNIDDHAKRYHHKPSGNLPQESILWAADLDLSMPVEDEILRYFVGPVLSGNENFLLKANMAGDLARVSGNVSLDLENANTFGVDILRLALRATMDGQHVDIHALEADTNLGAAAVNGFYEIMDGNFDLRLWAGKTPQDDAFTYVYEPFKNRLSQGISTLDILSDNDLKSFGGTLQAYLEASSNNGIIDLKLPKGAFQYTFNQPYLGIAQVALSPVSGSDNTILHYTGHTIESPAGLLVNLNKDTIRIAPALSIDLDNPMRSRANLKIDVQTPAAYAEAAGISGLSSDPFSTELNYQPCGNDVCGNLRIQTGNIRWMGVEIPDFHIDLNLDHSKLKTHIFRIDTNLLRVSADIAADIPNDAFSAPSAVPFHSEIRLSDIDFETINYEQLGLSDIRALKPKGKGEGIVRIEGPLDHLRARLRLVFDDLEAADVHASRLSLNARYEDKKIQLTGLNLWFDESLRYDQEISRQSENLSNNATASANVEANEAFKTIARSPYLNALPRIGANPDAPRRLSDFSINALTYDIEKNIVLGNIVLQPTSPNRFAPFKNLGLPVDFNLAIDLTARVDIASLMDAIHSGKPNSLTRSATWLEGDIILNDLIYDNLTLGNSIIQFSRSNQYALIKGNLIDILDLSGFVRTSPKLTASISLNFPNLDILDTLNQIGLDLQSTIDAFRIANAKVSGSIGFCMRSFDDMQLSVLLDDFSASVFGFNAALTQPAFIRADLNQMALSLSQLEFAYRDSVIKLSGSANKNGDVDIDLNGEIDTAIVRSFVNSVKTSSGLLGISFSAQGNLFNHDRISLDNMDIRGYFGVRDPIQIQTDIIASPFELSKGFLRFDNKDHRCGKREICVYTPDNQPFTVGIDNQWLELNLFAGSHGYIDANIGGTINTALSRLFVKDMTSAHGDLKLDAHINGNILDKKGNLISDFQNIDIGGNLEVVSPIELNLRSLNDPISLSDGVLSIAGDQRCPSGKPCVVIPKSRAFQGSVLGGNYIFFGEIVRDFIIPKSANLSISASDLNFRMKDELSVTLSPDIQINAADFSNFETVKISGDIDIAEAKYKKNFDDGSSNLIKEQILSMFVDSRRRVATYSPSFLRKMPDLGKIRFDIGVAAENSIAVDVKIAGATVALELGAQARIGGTITDIAPTGIFSINSGLFSMHENDFEFQNGSQIAFNGSMDGKIDITAAAEINTDSNAFNAVTGNTDLDKRKRIATSSNNASSDLYAITLTVGGSLFQPTWSFESSPYLSDANIYALILTGKTIDDFSGNDIAMESLLSPLFSSQLDAFINADQFKFLFSEGAAQFVYVKQITKALRIAAGVSIRGSDGNEQVLSGEYYFNDNWFIDLTGQNTSDEDGKAPTFKLGARLHWHLLLE